MDWGFDLGIWMGICMESSFLIIFADKKTSLALKNMQARGFQTRSTKGFVALLAETAYGALLPAAVETVDRFDRIAGLTSCES